MTYLGTRPPTVDEWEQYELHHRSRMSTKPGITGMWQVSGRSDITDFEEVVRLDTEYIENWTIGLDIKILMKTVLGRFDIQLSPLVSGIPGFLFEFKHTKDERVNLAVLADSALQQINEKKYDTELRNAGVNSIIKIGIAFRGKNAVVKRG